MIKKKYTSKYAYTWISLLCLIIEAAFAVVCIYQTTTSVGSSGLQVGCLGMLTVLTGILGFCMAWSDRKILGRKYRFPLVMLLLHGLLFILLAALYLLGLVSA
jgi:membrane associated rhomboid family serine protease